jgi:hypothetical protein
MLSVAACAKNLRGWGERTREPSFCSLGGSGVRRIRAAKKQRHDANQPATGLKEAPHLIVGDEVTSLKLLLIPSLQLNAGNIEIPLFRFSSIHLYQPTY